jgi:membrane protein implicated in regulation of membrane protease activity
MMNTVFIWLIVSLLLLTFEFGHPGLFFFLSFSLGSLSSAVLAFYDYSLAIQIVSFFVFSIIAFFFLRTYVKKTQRSMHHTNVYGLVGKRGVVTQDISLDNPGYVKVQGQYWLARSAGSHLAVGSKIIVKDVRGAHLIVEHYNTHNV